MAKNNVLKVKTSYPDAKTKQYVESALAIVNHFRIKQNMNIMSESTFVMNSVVTASNEVHKFYQEQLEKAKETVKAKENNGVEDAPQSEQVMANVETDNTGDVEADNNSSEGESDGK